jgi:integral membrane protein (TIGR01906 family)
MKIFKVVFRWVFILCFPILLLSTSLAICFNSQWMFHYGFEKYKVSQTTGLSTQNLNKIASSWIGYINSNKKYWDITLTQDGSTFTLFSHDEQMHFKDVKALIWFDYLVLCLTLALCFSYVLYRLMTMTGKKDRGLVKDIIMGSAITVGLILVLGIASFFDFDGLFLNMHYLLFSNDFWYAEGYMLELFPGGFWYDAAFITFGLMAGLALISGGIASLRLRSLKRINEQY